MVIPDQRVLLKRIGKELIHVSESEPFDWRRAKQLRNELGGALMTEAQKQKRQRHLDRRDRRKAAIHTEAFLNKKD